MNAQKYCLAHNFDVEYVRQKQNQLEDKVVLVYHQQ